MKKLLGIIILSLLLSGNAYAKEKKISNGLSINIPEGYHYFELTLKQIITRFPSLDINDFQMEGIDLEIGIDAKLIVLSNEKKTIKLVEDISSVSGLARLTKDYWEPFLGLEEDLKFMKIIKSYAKKKFSQIDLDNVSEEESVMIFLTVLNDKKFLKKIDKYIRPFIDKFNSDYEFDKATTIVIGDKKIKFMDELKKTSLIDARNLAKEVIKVMIKESPNDPMVKAFKNYKYEIEKNSKGNLYLYSNHIDFAKNVPIYKDILKYFKRQDIIYTTENDKLFVMSSTCYRKCDLTDFLEIIGPTNIYSKSKKKLKNVVSTSNEVDQLTDNLVEQLNQLNDLYKSGVLTKEEFKKAKKKLLN